MTDLDRIDCEILRHLQKNARISNKALAERVGVAESTCLARVRRLRERDVLRGFHATIHAEAVGIGLQAMVAVELGTHSRGVVQQFREAVRRRPEVVGLYHLGGRTDFLLHVAVRAPGHLRDWILSTLTERDEVARVETSLLFDHEQMAEWPIYPSAREARSR